MLLLVDQINIIECIFIIAPFAAIYELVPSPATMSLISKTPKLLVALDKFEVYRSVSEFSLIKCSKEFLFYFIFIASFCIVK